MHSHLSFRIRVMVTDVSLKFLLPSHPRYLSVVRAAVGELGPVCGLPAEEWRGIVLAVDEALANIIRHAYLGHSDRQIEVNCQASIDRQRWRKLSTATLTAGSTGWCQDSADILRHIRQSRIEQSRIDRSGNESRIRNEHNDDQ
jgi:two-component sensor histidine kinase